MSIRWTPCAMALIAWVALGFEAGAQPASPPWEAQPFAADPKAVLKAAAAHADQENDVVVLFEEARYTLDPEGRCDYVYRIAFRIQTDAGAASWASIAAEWAPWHQARPELRARVVSPEGRVHVLDPATIAEAGVGDDDPRLYSDRRRVRAPLPAVKAGAVVEQEIRIVDKEPPFGSGTRRQFSIGAGVPVLRTRVSVDAPQELPIRHLLRGVEGGTVDRQRENGRLQLLVEIGRLEALEAPEPWLPADRPRGPYFAFSTGASWAAVARSYAGTVDAQIGVAPVAALRRGVTREAVAARLLKRLHEEVRYTGVEFGQAAYVPRTPADVLARRYGDCKDKSALLVSRLRAEGVPAFVALLKADYGTDVEPDLPALDVFNHAIVVLPGPPALWIDPTDEFARVNQLPIADQGRLALIAAADTIELTRTPLSTSAENVLRRTREYRLSEASGTVITETTRPSGTLESAYRSYYAQSDPDQRRQGQEKYARAEFGATATAAVRHTDPRDMSVPFEVTLESRVEGAAAQPTFTLNMGLAGLFSRLPETVTKPPAEGEGDAIREAPFQITEPHRVEWTYRVMPPAGFIAKQLPEPEKATLGPSSVDVRFDQKADGAIEGRLAFDSGARVIDPKQFAALREGARTWRARVLSLELQDKAHDMLASGRTCDGLRALQDAAARDPKRAAARERLAQALLEAGLGEAAREEARRAVALDPQSSSAQRILGWTLEHDPAGRRFKKGSDRAGAEAAYKKALELDPDSRVARASLALLYEFNEAGTHWGIGARLEDAVREIQSFRADHEDATGLDVNLLYGLMLLGRFEEMEQVAEEMEDGVARNELLLVAAAARRGPKAAIAEAARLFPDPAQRRDAFQRAGNSLVELRRYPAAVPLLNESANGAADAADRRQRAERLARVKRYEELTLPEDDPRTAVKKLFIAIADVTSGARGVQALTDVLSLSDAERAQAEADPEAFRKGVLHGIQRATTSGVEMSRGMVDIVLSVGELVAEGDPEIGYRVRMQVAENADSAYVVRVRGRYRILALDNDLPRVAAEAWRLVDAGKTAAAARWLDWIREDVQTWRRSEEDPLDGTPFLQLWTPNGRRDADTARIAAASLFWDEEHAGKGVQALTLWREGLTREAERTTVDRALLSLLTSLDKHAEIVPVARRLLRAHPTSSYAFNALVHALNRTGLRDDARAVCRERLDRKPGDLDGLRCLAQADAAAGRYDAAETTYAEISGSGRSESLDWNQRAWNAALRAAVDEGAVEWGHKATQARSSAPALHTLATLYAERGQVREAHQVLVRSLAAGTDAVRSDDWYVLGRMAEQCGLVDTARQSYAKVARKNDMQDTGVLAERALARLAKTASPRRAAR